MKFPFVKISHLCMGMRDLCANIYFTENEYFFPEMISFALEIFMGNWPVHYFMHGILIHEDLCGKFSFYLR